MVQMQRASGDGEDGGELQPSSLLISAVSTTASEIKYSMPRNLAWHVSVMSLMTFDPKTLEVEQRS